MLVDIDKIIVGDRIRKDFGDIQELADDIKENGLINPPTINKSYVLLAGERRLRACKSLGWTQIEVHMLDTKDEAHDLAVEMSENNMRRNFTGSELAEGIRRQMAIEAEKARERMAEGGRGGNVSTPSSTARDKAGEHFGISGRQADKVLYVADNQDLLEPADFADWDEGKLSTNKAFKLIKAAKAQAERDLKIAEKERDAAYDDLAEAYRDNEAMETEVEYLRKRVAEGPKPEVVEREVVREVIPADYEDMKRHVKDLEHANRIYVDTDRNLRAQLDSAHKELDRAKDILGMDKTAKDVRMDVQYLIGATNGYVRRYGGLTWTVQQLEEVDEATLEQLRMAVRNLATFSSTLMTCLENANGND